MGLFSFFGKQESHVERIQKILVTGRCKFSDLEQKCISEAFSKFTKPGSVFHPQFRNAVTAFGLWVCKEVLWDVSTDKINMFPELAKQDWENANYAMAKAYFIFPMPIFLFRIGYLLDFMHDPAARDFLQIYLRAESKFVPEQLHKMFLDLMLPTNGVSGKPIDHLKVAKTILNCC